MKTPARIFLSYAKEDKDEVEKIYENLKQAGHQPWMDEKDIPFGTPWKDVIEETIDNADFFMVLLSKKSVDKEGFFQAEIKSALEVNKRKPQNSAYIIPVLLENCKVPRKLDDRQWARLFEKGVWEKLLIDINSEMERRAKSKASSAPMANRIDERLRFRAEGEKILSINCESVVKLLQDIHNIPDDLIYRTRNNVKVPFLLKNEHISELQKDVDSILGQPLGDLYKNAFIHSLKKTDNEDTEIDPSEKPNKFVCTHIKDGKIYCGRTNYHTIIQLCDALTDELFIFLAQNSLDDTKIIESGLKLRLAAAQSVDEIENPSMKNRIAGVGFSCFMALKDGQEWRGCITKRSEKVRVYKNCYHVVPSAMFDSLTVNYEQEFSVKHNIFREIMEEIFDDEELQNIDKMKAGPAVFDFFYDKEPLVDLTKMLENGSAILTLLGFGIDLLNLRPEILAMLIIKDQVWMQKYRRQLRFNWEYSKEDVGKQLRSIKEIEELLRSTSFAQWVPGGYIAADIGVNLFPKFV
jgi:hypothetical protein